MCQPLDAPRKPPLPAAFDDETDENADDEADAEDEPDPDDDSEDDELDDDDLDDDPDPEPEDGDGPEPPGGRSARARRARRERRPKGAGGMGRPSTGPLPRRRSPAGDPAMTAARGPQPLEAEPESELVAQQPEIESWPGTSEAARLTGRHPSTIKLWRTQGRIRAIQDGAGCWRHNPDDLAENIDTPDGTDPGAVLAQGMSAIVAQGAAASDRLLSMTELATEGLKNAAEVLRDELKAAYARIRELEKERVELLEQAKATHAEDLKHDRLIRRMDHQHALKLAGSSESSERLNGIITLVGPIAASIAARWLGKEAEALKLEASAVGVAPVSTTAPPTAGASSDAVPPSASPPSPDMPLESKVTDAMVRLCAALRNLNPAALAALESMLPTEVAAAVHAVRTGESDAAVGKALSVIITASQKLSDLQFATLRPITPVDVANALADLRALIRTNG